MSTNAELQINLAALKRQDPYISNITDSSTHVAVYSFSPQSNEWEKTDVEGTLFVYKRVAPPYWGFTIMNRLSMENLAEPLTSELEFQTQNPFLLYRNAKLLIYGIWFYDHDDCKRIGELLEKLCRGAGLDQDATSRDNAQTIDLFGPSKAQDAAQKSSSPNSNSVTSTSPGSSVGGVQRPPSNNDEADSESEEKEVVQSTKTSINIMDLLSKAQDKYEKEKRNTPDPTTELQNGALISPTDAERPLMKPVPVKPSHPQKLDVASLFKQQPTKLPEVMLRNNELQAVPNPAPVHAPYGGLVMPQAMNPSALPSTANVSIPQRQRRPQMSRSYSLNEMALRGGINSFMNGTVMSLEEVEASLANNVDPAAKQQDVNLALDKIIDRINSSGGVAAPLSSQPPNLPNIRENVYPQPPSKTPTDDVFSTISNPFPTSMPRFPKPASMATKQRSISTSGIQFSSATLFGSSTPTMTTPQGFNHSFPATDAPATCYVPVTTLPPTLPPMSLMIRGETSLLLHGKAVNANSTSSSSTLVSTVANSSSVIPSNGKPMKPVSSMSKPSDIKSPVLSANLISPEDFERSASTPQKKLELKNRLLREIPPIAPVPPTGTIAPLTKEQLQQTLVSLLQKDSEFITKIHSAYLSSFKQS